MDAVRSVHLFLIRRTLDCQLNWDRWLEIDQGLPVAGSVTDDDIVAEVITSSSAQNDSEPEIIDCDTSDDEANAYLPTPTEMRQAVEILRKGLYGRGFGKFSLMNKVERAVTQVSLDTMTQSKLDNFFNVR